MRKSRFTETQIVSIRKEHDAPQRSLNWGAVTACIRTRWLPESKYGGMAASELARAPQLEDENGRLNRIIAKLSLENDAMKA